MIRVLIFFIFSSYLYANDIQKAFLASIYDNQYNLIENVQHKTITNNKYFGTYLFNVVVIGNYNKNVKVVTKINNSVGKLIKTEVLFNKINKRVYGKILFFELNVEQSGYFEVFINNKLYDTKVFIR